jgi:hypothetical protein
MLPYAFLEKVEDANTILSLPYTYPADCLDSGDNLLHENLLAVRESSYCDNLLHDILLAVRESSQKVNYHG